MSEIMVELKDGFEYASKGEKVKANFITITPPTFKQMSKVTPIKQAFSHAIQEIQKNQGDKVQSEKDADKKITASEVIMLMNSWSGDLVKVHLYAQDLFVDCCMVDGEVKLTKPLIDMMSMVDFELLVGNYIANFIVPSLMDG